METIQIVLDKPLLQAANRRAKRAKQNRSALFREALREHLRRLEIKEMEEREIAGYARIPQTQEEIHMWDGETAWQDD